MPAPEKLSPNLSPHYYRHHFQFLLDWMEQYYAHVLDEEDQGFIRKFKALSGPAQCLYVRLANRSGICFRVKKFDYPEINNLPAALKELQTADFVQPAGPVRTDRTGNLLNTLTRPELLAFIASENIQLPRSLKKAQLVQALLDHAEIERLLTRVIQSEAIVFQQHDEMVTWFNFLFFGNLHENTTQFVRQDLGQLQVEAREGCLFTPRYRDRQEALDCYDAARARRNLSALMEQADIEDALTFFMSWHQAHPGLSEAALPRRDKMILNLAAELERQKRPDQARTVYALTDQPPSRERQVRILYNTRQVEEAYTLAQRMQQDPRNADEEVFAADLLTRKQLPRSVKKTSVQLRRARTIKLSGAYRDRVEQGVLEHYRQQGQDGFFAENRPWHNLFGLLCWEVLFPQDSDVLHHPLQTAPSDLYDVRFFERREKELIQCLSVLDDRNACRTCLEACQARHQGQSNPFVDWSPESLAQVRVLCDRAPGAGLRAVLLEMARNLRANRKGFPDLFLWSDTLFEWVEVKAPHDTLSARQLCWLNFFNEHDMPARVLKVSWKAGT